MKLSWDIYLILKLCIIKPFLGVGGRRDHDKEIMQSDKER